ncbi:MAG: hypothetical protein HYV09_23805 [Deltaproteobacteria bacterium]|nr:hypothetical protein [Deltaproteobacteria bacterium]
MSLSSARTAFAVTCFACLACETNAAGAEADDKALATDLFAKGNKLLEAGGCDQEKIADRGACEQAREHFERAYELYPQGLGALRNLAYVERGLGRLANAARRFRELKLKAPSDPNPKRHLWAEYAAQELEAIEPRIPHLTIRVPSDPPEAMTVTIDDDPLPSPAWGTALELDPGTHQIRARGKGVAPFESTVTLVEREDRTITIQFAKSAPPHPPPSSDDRPAPSASRPVLPLVVAGAGAAVVVTGLGFGYAAMAGKRDACGDGKLCEPEGLSDARGYAVTANVLTGVGAALLIGGALWYSLAPARSANVSGVHVVPIAGLGVSGGAIIGRFE